MRAASALESQRSGALFLAAAAARLCCSFVAEKVGRQGLIQAEEGVVRRRFRCCIFFSSAFSEAGNVMALLFILFPSSSVHTSSEDEFDGLVARIDVCARLSFASLEVSARRLCRTSGPIMPRSCKYVTREYTARGVGREACVCSHSLQLYWPGSCLQNYRGAIQLLPERQLCVCGSQAA